MGTLERDRFDCKDCGEGVPADEDGCCVMCGRTCAVVEDGEVVMRPEDWDKSTDDYYREDL